MFRVKSITLLKRTYLLEVTVQSKTRKLQNSTTFLPRTCEHRHVYFGVQLNLPAKHRSNLEPRSPAQQRKYGGSIWDHLRARSTTTRMENTHRKPWVRLLNSCLLVQELFSSDTRFTVLELEVYCLSCRGYQPMPHETNGVKERMSFYREISTFCLSNPSNSIFCKSNIEISRSSTSHFNILLAKCWKFKIWYSPW